MSVVQPGHRGGRWPAASLIVVIVAGLLFSAGCSDGGPDKHNASSSAATEPEPDRPLDSAGLREHIVGHTVIGTLEADHGYTEFFAGNGIIHGAGYRAHWRIANDRLCLNYDQTTQSDCYRIRLHGNVMHWLQAGQVRGQARVVAGNPQHL